MAKAAATKKKKQTNNNKKQHATVDNSSEPNKDNSNKRGKEDKTEGKIVGEVHYKNYYHFANNSEKGHGQCGQVHKGTKLPPNCYKQY